MIPCLVTVVCEDSEALDLLSSPHAINVRLRRIATLIQAGSVLGRGLAPPKRDISQDFGTAVWWPRVEHSDAKQPLNTRHLEGEIRLAKSLVPSFDMGCCTVEVGQVL